MANETVKVPLSKALAVFLFVGWSTASKWDCKRATEKIVNVPDVLTTEPTDPDIKKTVIDIMAALEAKKTIEVVPNDAVVEAGEGSEGETTTETAEKPAKAEKAPKAEKPPKEPKPAKAPKEPKAAPVVAVVAKVGNVRPAKNRIYAAAQVLKKHGLQNGCTDEMAAEVDELCEKKNLKESAAWLRICWDAINGYTNSYPVDPVTPVAKVEDSTTVVEEKKEEPVAVAAG